MIEQGINVKTMDRGFNRLSALEVKGLNRKGMYHDGGGLYLQVSSSGAKSWIYRFMLDGRPREMGLGPLSIIPLAEARKRAAECRRMRLDGIDPIEARKTLRDQKKLEAAKAMISHTCLGVNFAGAPGRGPSASRSATLSSSSGTS